MSSSTSQPPVTAASLAPTPAATPAVSRTSGTPEWLSPLLQGITLLAVIGGVFAAGIWRGEIDTKLDDILRARDGQPMEMKELSQQVAELSKSISYLQGTLQGSKGDGKSGPRASH